jgi:hypothetical protein
MHHGHAVWVVGWIGTRMGGGSWEADGRLYPGDARSRFDDQNDAFYHERYEPFNTVGKSMMIWLRLFGFFPLLIFVLVGLPYLVLLVFLFLGMLIPIYLLEWCLTLWRKVTR